MSENTAEHYRERISRMRSLGWEVEGELHESVYRAHRLGVPIAELARLAETDEQGVRRILDHIVTGDLRDDGEPEPDWLYSRGGAIFSFR